MAIYNYNGTQINDGYNISGSITTPLYDYNGQALETPICYCKKVAIIGDSILDLSLTGQDDRPSTNKPQVYLSTLMNGLNIINMYNNTTLATGGSGYCQGATFYSKSAVANGCIPSDTDLIIIYGSVNDWKYRSLNSLGGTATNRLCLTNNCSSDVNGTLLWATNPHLDRVSDYTLAGYFNETIINLHNTAPNAKIAIITPLYYYGAGEKYFFNVIKMYQMCAMALADNYGYDINVYNLFYDAGVTGSNNTYSVSANVQSNQNNGILHRTEILDTELEGNLGLSIDSYKLKLSYYETTKLSGNNYDFAYFYAYDYTVGTSNSYGHLDNHWHENYMAPHFAHIIVQELGNKTVAEADTLLPTALKYNNL